MALKQEISFAVVKRNGTVIRIGRSEMTLPPVKFSGGSVKWFDDSKLVRGHGSEESCGERRYSGENRKRLNLRH